MRPQVEEHPLPFQQSCANVRFLQSRDVRFRRTVAECRPLTLTMTELDRLQILTRIAERRLTAAGPPSWLRLSERQVRRRYRAFARAGAAGVTSRRRGRPSNRRLADATPTPWRSCPDYRSSAAPSTT
jgi:hypothetical protein